MKTDIQIFNYSLFGEVRVTTNQIGEPLFCLADVCKVLELTNASEVKNRLSDGVISTYPIIDNLGREQQATFVNEDGLYDVILDSRKPEAKQFRKWITSEVLPSVRKHGGYLTPQKIEEVLLNPDTIIQLATNLKESRAKLEIAEKQIEAQTPKVLFADSVSTSDSSILVAELAKILKQNGIEIGQNRLFSWMRENGYLCSKGEYYNTPTQKAMNLGLFEMKKQTVTMADGTVLVSTTPKVTGKGQIYFINKFLTAA